MGLENICSLAFSKLTWLFMKKVYSYANYSESRWNGRLLKVAIRKKTQFFSSNHQIFYSASLGFDVDGHKNGRENGSMSML